MPLSEILRLSRELIPGTGPPHIQPLRAGLTNETFRVERNEESYALRVAGADPEPLGLDRVWEEQILKAAGASGLAPPLVRSDAARGLLVTRWVFGRTWSESELPEAANLRKITALMRRVHALSIPACARIMSPASWIELYLRALSQREEPAPDSILQSMASAYLERLAELPPGPRVVCHSDMHRMNLIEAEETLLLLDWEYAHVSEPLWDVAAWSANNDLDADAQHALLLNYRGSAPAAAERARFRLMLWLYDYVCLLWCELYLNLRQDRDNRVLQRLRQLDARLRLPAH
jgi:thiamine kinase-like enzyme